MSDTSDWRERIVENRAEKDRFLAEHPQSGPLLLVAGGILGYLAHVGKSVF